MRDVQAGLVHALVRAGLPHVVAEHAAGGAVDDVRGGVVPHELPPAGLIDRAGDRLTHLDSRYVIEEVQDGVADLLHVDHVAVLHDAVVGLLPAPFRVEVCPVQDDPVIDDRHDLGLERHDLRVLVISEHRLGHVLRELLAARALVLLPPRGRLLLFVLACHYLVESIGDLHRHIGVLLHDLRVEAMGVVQLDQLFYSDRFALQPFRHLLHYGSPALEGLVVPAFLNPHQVHYVITVFDQFWEVRGEVIDLHADDIGQRAGHVQMPHGPQCATDEHAGEVSLSYVAGHDAIVQHERQGAGVVTDDIEVFHRLDGGQ